MSGILSLPTGKEVQNFEKFVCSFVRKEWLPEECVMTREDWLDCVEHGAFIPDDGTLGEIIIDGQLTCYELKGWDSGFYFGTDSTGNKIYIGDSGQGIMFRVKRITIEEFKALEGKVEVAWYNK